MPEPVTIAGRYEVVRTLGQGSFAHTLLARDLRLERDVALKILHPEARASLKAYELFEREAAVLRELRHPGVPAIHATLRAQWNGSEAAFLVMEYVEGASLAELIQTRRHLGLEEVHHLFLEMLGVLDYLHGRVPPVLHRDLKPANVILRPDGSPALVDFGAVRNVFRPPDEGGSTIVGTYGYMPYEQYMGQASPSSDLYALAATFLHLITGRAPPEFMSGEGRIEVPAALPCGEPLRSVLARMLAPSPSERFQSARAARAGLIGLAPVPARTAETALEPAPRSRVPAGLFEAGPRPIRGETRSLMRRVVSNPWRLMSPSERPSGGIDIVTLGLTAFFSVITAGILPLWFISIYLSRRRRYRKFFQRGLPGTARILEMSKDDIGWGEKLSRVRYEFEADGRRHRGSDQTLPIVADRWDVGDVINILYIPDDEYDSCIISVS